MAQTYTLDEAAERLGLTTAEMKKRLQTDPDFKKLSQIRDGSTVRFKVTAIDELARQLGMASEDALALAPLDDPEPPGSDDFKVPGIEDKKKPSKKLEDAPLDFDASDDAVFSLADEPKAAAPKSSGKLTPPKPPKSSPRMAMSDSSTGSDSDVRLEGKAKKPKSAADEAAVPTEEIALDFSGPGSAVIKGGSSAKLSAPKTGGSSGKLDAGKGKGAKPPEPSVNDSSEFELSLDADSDDFDLQMAPDAGDEVDLGSLPKSNAPRSGASGINLSAPADSGISLEKGKSGKKDAGKSKPGHKTGDSDSDVDFELSLDSSAVASNTKLGAPQSGKLVLDSDSDSEFELTLDDSGGSLEQAALDADADGEDKGDIFETDFEIPAMPDESGSEAVALESDTDLEKSDFELAMDDSDVATDEDSASEVVLLDDEEAEAKPKGRAAAKGKKKAVADDADVDLSDEVAVDEEDASASKALKGAKNKKRATDDDDEEDAVPAGAGAPTAQWGVLPVLFLAPALVLTIAGGLMGYELLQTMWGYQQPRKPTAPIVRGIASQFDMELKDQ